MTFVFGTSLAQTTYPVLHCLHSFLVNLAVQAVDMKSAKARRDDMQRDLSQLHVGSQTNDPKKIDWRRIVKGLVLVGAPLIAMQIVILVCASPYLATDRDLGQVEYFSGLQAVTQAAEKRGLKTYPFDINIDPKTMDINSPIGFVHALHSTMRLEPGGWSWAAPVCSTWGKLCLAVTKRSAEDASGDQNRECVRLANKMVSRLLSTGRRPGTVSRTFLNPNNTLNATKQKLNKLDKNTLLTF